MFAGRFDQLGHDVTIGTRAWNAQARIVLKIGPLSLPAFEALLPQQAKLRSLVSLVRSFLGFETGFAINPVLAASEVPALQLDVTGAGGPRLGWNCWIPTVGTRNADAAEAVFEAEVVEALAG